ncbi:response regulator [Erythrobacter rubeus]|uniref:Response regulator n=1 Tax=Erythrobacter rubeus TaxID=2760803 RepID=A0ABR8KNG3_9SPHN|nr:response regulator [Erythrobacter rubeus]MBD2840900.1 response regulator [Erythrobacter rubeus]
MPRPCTLLVLEDEPLIMMDLQFSGEDQDCTMLCAASCGEALQLIDKADTIDAAILDVSLGAGKTCLPVARKLENLSIPYILHSGDLDRHDETIRTLDAKLVAKPFPAEKVIAAAIACAVNDDC